MACPLMGCIGCWGRPGMTGATGEDGTAGAGCLLQPNGCGEVAKSGVTCGRGLGTTRSAINLNVDKG